MISHKRWPLLHYLGFKRQLGEFLGQLPQLKASMNSPPLRTQITVGHKVTKEGHEDDFLKSGTAAKVRQVAAADCRARGWWRGVYLIFVVSWLVSWISASWELSRLHHSALEAGHPGPWYHHHHTSSRILATGTGQAPLCLSVQIPAADGRTAPSTSYTKHTLTTEVTSSPSKLNTKLNPDIYLTAMIF